MIFLQGGINTPVKRSYPVGNRPIDQFMPTKNIDSRTIAQNKLTCCGISNLIFKSG
ncbi:MAG: hypothetical protein ICV61_05930 [Microcoleus sp. Co-bin12]|nr:hypothetical protein [Microcoleus sp. Co-bin12]